MIRHFLKRDFLDFLLYWIVLLVITVVGILAYYSPLGPFSFQVFFFAYWFFPMMAQQYILGSVWRTQHQLSRHYLLSLPMSHKALFRIQQLRILVFWLPFLVLTCLLPYWAHTEFKDLSFTTEAWIFYYFGLFVSVAVLIHTTIWSTVETERILSYLAKGERLWANIKLYGITFGFLIIIMVGWQSFLLSSVAPVSSDDQWAKLPFLAYFSDFWVARVVFLGSFMGLIFLIPRNARRWCVTL